MGAAYLIPGVSGGTAALLTGIYERIIHSLKSIDFNAFKLLFTGKLREFVQYTDVFFLLTVIAGILTGLFSLATLLTFLLNNYSTYVGAYFFGLILASVPFIGRNVTKKTHWLSILLFLIGATFAATISLISPAMENSSMLYLFINGMLVVIGMLLPGISSSYILVLTGNYKLVVIDGVNKLNWAILLPFFVGILVGIPILSRFLSWILTKFKDFLISLVSGIIFGSLTLLWPWKTPIYKLTELGHEVLTKTGEPIIEGYHLVLPKTLNINLLITIGLIVAGFLSVWIVDKLAEQKNE